MADQNQAPLLRPIRDIRSRVSAGRGGRPLALSTITRWILRGVTTPAGRVRLKATRIGAAWYTTDEAFDEFLAAQTAAHMPAEAPPAETARGPVAHRTASDRAADELKKLGC